MSENKLCSTSCEKRKYRDILVDGCICTENGFVLCAIDAVNVCKYRQKSDKFDPGNFIRHMRTEHPVLAKARGLLKEEAEIPAKKRKPSKTLIALDRQTVLEAMIKLVTVHNVPMVCVEWEGLQLILQPICEALKLQLNRPNLVFHLVTAAAKIRIAIAREVKGKLLCLKIDTATRLGRHILGINIQFFEPEQKHVVIYTIGMIELNERHTAKFLKTKIVEILATYEISLDQIFTITTDNGANMIATVNQLKSDLQVMLFPYDDEDDNAENAEEAINWSDAIEKEFYNTITLVRCAVHTMQLAVTDVIKTCDADIRECCTVSKNCRKIAYKTVFNELSLPPLYSKTRWGGVFDMLNHFCKYEAFFNELGLQYTELDLSERWEFIKEYVTSFKPLYIATKNMQAKHTSLNDFYITWMRTMMEVSRIKSNRFVEPLTAALKQRLKQLKGNMVIKAALLMDPRFNYLNSGFFSPEEKEEIRRFIIGTSERIQRYKAKINDHSSPSSSTSSGANVMENINDLSDFDAFLTNEFGGSLPEANPDLSQPSDRFIRQLNELDLEPHQKSDFDVWIFWMSRKHSHPELYDVATLLLAVPSNQVSVERAFSALGLVLTDKRTKMNDDTLENILLIKLNKQLFEKIIPNLYNWLEEDL